MKPTPTGTVVVTAIDRNAGTVTFNPAFPGLAAWLPDPNVPPGYAFFGVGDTIPFADVCPHHSPLVLKGDCDHPDCVVQYVLEE